MGWVVGCGVWVCAPGLVPPAGVRFAAGAEGDDEAFAVRGREDSEARGGNRGCSGCAGRAVQGFSCSEETVPDEGDCRA